MTAGRIVRQWGRGLAVDDECGAWGRPGKNRKQGSAFSRCVTGSNLGRSKTFPTYLADHFGAGHVRIFALWHAGPHGTSVA